MTTTAADHDTTEKPDPLRGLSPRGRSRLLEIKARNAMVTAIQGESWGGGLSKRQAQAFAEFIRRFKLDISEIDNLGGRPYRNGRYYMRKTAELAAAGRVEWYKGRHIGPDARLEALANAGEQWAIDEHLDRLKECIRLGVPEEAQVVYLVTVKMKELALPTEGVKWWVPQSTGTAKRKKADPIADENPVTSTETRAWRRAGRLYAAEIPELYLAEEEMEFAAAAIGTAAIDEAEEAEGVEITPAPLATDGADPYSDAPARQLGEGPAQPLHANARPENLEAARAAVRSMGSEDPYTGTKVKELEPDFSNESFPDTLP